MDLKNTFLEIHYSWLRKLYSLALSARSIRCATWTDGYTWWVSLSKTPSLSLSLERPSINHSWGFRSADLKTYILHYIALYMVCCLSLLQFLNCYWEEKDSYSFVILFPICRLNLFWWLSVLLPSWSLPSCCLPARQSMTSQAWHRDPKAVRSCQISG